MVRKIEDLNEFLTYSFQSIEHPELVYKTSREIQKSAYTSLLAFLLIMTAILNSSRFDYFQVVLIAGSSLIIELVSLIFLTRWFFLTMN
ncbi:MAG: hypothetical protein ACFFEV_04020, partial [Candidatus Thorarchaeota archaeon]